MTVRDALAKRMVDFCANPKKMEMAALSYREGVIASRTVLRELITDRFKRVRTYAEVNYEQAMVPRVGQQAAMAASKRLGESWEGATANFKAVALDNRLAAVDHAVERYKDGIDRFCAKVLATLEKKVG